MKPAICATCGTQYPPSAEAPARCEICEDFRQFVGLDGQQWTTLEDLRATHRNRWEELGGGMASIHTEPKFAIGQRCLLARGKRGNLLWDAVPLVDEETVGKIRAEGGVEAIAISHPHYYSAMVEWSRALGGAPILLHEDDAQWVMRPDVCIRFWSGETLRVNDDATLIRCGGHFEGAQVMHLADGALLTGDVIQVVADRRWVSFMRSYPNYIPLPASAVKRIVAAIEPFAFDRLYGAWPKFEIASDAKGAVRRSAERYVRALGGVLPGAARSGGVV
jgi:hypothetical protein